MANNYFPATRIDSMSDNELVDSLSESCDGMYDIENSALGIISDVLIPGTPGIRRYTSTHERYIFLISENDNDDSIIGIIEE